VAVNSGTLALTTTAVQLGSRSIKGVTIHNNDGSINVLVGGAGTQSFTISPGGTSGRIVVANLNQVWVKSASGTPTVSWLSD